MTKTELHKLLTQIAEKWEYTLDTIGDDYFRMDVAIKIDDEKWRHQFVNIWLKTEGEETYIYLNSRVGKYYNTTDHYMLLVQSGFCKYSSVTILPDKINNKECESICVSASPHTSIITQELLDTIIYDVGSNADYLESKIYGKDRN